MPFDSADEAIQAQAAGGSRLRSTCGPGAGTLLVARAVRQKSIGLPIPDFILLGLGVATSVVLVYARCRYEPGAFLAFLDVLGYYLFAVLAWMVAAICMAVMGFRWLLAAARLLRYRIYAPAWPPHLFFANLALAAFNLFLLLTPMEYTFIHAW